MSEGNIMSAEKSKSVYRLQKTVSVCAIPTKLTNGTFFERNLPTVQLHTCNAKQEYNGSKAAASPLMEN